ncbi:carbamoyl-phosphate synthase large subunit [Alcaligenaceae bacterium]|nr:carbamoyl-phosphate synthase large subunit [Alcaligenaceae bacterium]
MSKTFRKILIANRGEVAIRVARAAAGLGVPTVAVYADEDARGLHPRHADEAVALGGAGVRAYLDMNRLLEIAHGRGCDAVHPGYGFLSENAEFARRCIDAGLTFIGPAPDTLSLFGDKAAARALAQREGVALARGSNTAVSLERAQAFMAALQPGTPVVIKALAGGGGRGMRIARTEQELAPAYEAACSEARLAFGLDAVYVEEYLEGARHIEIQVAGDRDGEIVHFGERECSLQWRSQKLVEFAPSPWLAMEARERIIRDALALARAAGVHTLSTFEFLLDASGRHVFMEANPRLQVEHTVTEEIMGVDLVQAQIQLAAGGTLASLGLSQSDIPAARGLAVQLRINQQEIRADGSVVPGSGLLTAFDLPSGPGIRIETHGFPGAVLPGSFDALLAKLVVHINGNDVRNLLARAYRALCETRIEGVASNVAFLRNLLAHPEVILGRFDTGFVLRHVASLADGEISHRLLAPERASAPLADMQPPEGDDEDHGDGIPLRSEVGGRLVALRVENGGAVVTGQIVAIVESMKMEQSVMAPCSGVVLACLAREGDVLQPGAALLRLAPAEIGAEQDESPRQAGALDAGLESSLADLQGRKAALLDGQRPDQVARQRERAQMTARERIERLCDPGTFQEIGGLIQAQHLPRPALADGLVVGSGRIDGRYVMVLAQDFTVYGGSAGHLGRQKMLRAMQRCRTDGLPLVMLLDGGGHRIQDGQNSRLYAPSSPLFQDFATLSGWVPMVAAVFGAGFAANTNFCGMADLVVMVRGQAEMGLAGPALVKAGTGQDVSAQALGGAQEQVDRNGLADLGVEDESQALGAIRSFLSYLPANARQPLPIAQDYREPDAEALLGMVPLNTRRAYDVRAVVAGLADIGSVFEIKPTYAGNLVTSLARIGGRPVGFIANQPLVKGGMLDSLAAEKGAHFIALCDAYGLPLVYLVDIPGMSIGPQAERTMLGRRSAKMLFELGHATVPRFSIVLRKGYGLGYVAMCGGRSFSADACLAWPGAEICAMSIEGSVDVAYRKEYERADDPGARRQALIDEIREQVSAVKAAEGFGVDDVIDPRETRQRLLDLLRQVPARRQSLMPPKFRAIVPI